VAGGPITVEFIGHATTRIELGGITILTDPFLRARLGPLERHGPLPDLTSLVADVVLISHGHRDHFDAPSLERLPGRPAVVMPAGLADARLSGRLAASGMPIHGLVASESLTIGGVTITAVPARHWISPGAPRAAPLGFMLDAGRRVYFAGDTGPFAAMRDIAGHVDLALLPIWTWGPHLGPGHLGPRSAATAARDIEARAVVPIHWGTLYPRQLHRVWRSPLRDPGSRFAGHMRELAPGVDARVLQPGEATTFSD
jgi:L-ascorbate metabolism protein UlaG (beta-lactamase superfamily)